MGRKKIIKCLLITASFVVVLLLFNYLSFINDREGSFKDFVENTNFSMIIFLSVVGLLSYAFRVGLNKKDDK